MLRFRLLVAACLAIVCVSTRAAPADTVDSAMRCVQAAMTNDALPAGVANEQIARAALAHCFDQIESAASAMANKRSAIEAVRATLRMQLYEYALQVAGTTYAAPAYVADTDREEASGALPEW